MNIHLQQKTRNDEKNENNRPWTDEFIPVRGRNYTIWDYVRQFHAFSPTGAEGPSSMHHSVSEISLFHI
jgi:hypothetical protein